MKYEIQGNLVSEDVRRIKEEVSMLINKNTEITMDFINTEYVDSIGLGMLVSLYKHSLEKNTRIKFINVNQKVMKLLKITALDKLFFE